MTGYDGILALVLMLIWLANEHLKHRALCDIRNLLAEMKRQQEKAR